MPKPNPHDATRKREATRVTSRAVDQEWLEKQREARHDELLAQVIRLREELQLERARRQLLEKFRRDAMALCQVADSFQSLAEGLRKVAERSGL